MAVMTWELDEGDDRDPCPMGCGRLTDDVAGGPCSVCWEACVEPDEHAGGGCAGTTTA